MNDRKKPLRNVYDMFGDEALPYTVDFRRFAYSLRMLDERGLLNNKRVLDVGSGIWLMAVAMSKLGANVSGLDKFIFPTAAENPYRIKNFERIKNI